MVWVALEAVARPRAFWRAIFADELRGEDVGRRRSRERVLRTIPANGKDIAGAELVARADAARLRGWGSFRYSPANVLLIAQKFARKILADYQRGWGPPDSLRASWSEIA